MDEKTPQSAWDVLFADAERRLPATDTQQTDNGETRQLRASLIQALEEAQVHRQRAEALAAERRSLQSALATTQREAAALQDALKVAQQETARLQTELAKAEQSKQQLAALLEERDAALQEIDSLRAQLAELDSYSRSLQESLTRLQRYANDLTAAVQDRDRKIAEMRATRRWRLGEMMSPWLHLPARLLRRQRFRRPPLVAPENRTGQPAETPTSAGQPLTLPAPATYDVICLAIIDWDFRFQRPQQIASAFARAGHRVFWVSPTRYLSPNEPPFRIKPLAPSIWEVRTTCRVPLDVYQTVLGAEETGAIVRSLDAIRRVYGIYDATCLVQIPFWTSVAAELRRQHGWRVVYDCMDEWETFPGIGPGILEQEKSLAASCDVLAVTAQRLADKWRAANRACILVRNGVDIEHFEQSWSAPLLEDVPHPIIGYFGAIAEWFDLALLHHVARARPHWHFALVGGVYGVDVASLQELPNVHFLGNQPYDMIPGYLRAFDVCLIPFKINKVTEATDPVKFYEYISLGKPVVATDLPELHFYGDCVYLARNADEFVEKIECALNENDPARVQQRMELARHNTWDHRYEALDQAIRSTYPLVSVIVVSYNNSHLTQQCLQSIFQYTTYPRYEVIVVDNASGDDTHVFLERLQTEHANVRLILNDENRGFAAANNQGIAQAQGDIIVFLNNDTVVTPGWLARLVRHLEDNTIGLVGAVTNFAGNEAKIDVPYRNLADLESFSREYTLCHEGQVFDIRMVALFCAAMRKADLVAVGGLDEGYGIGMFEDDDLAQKVRHQLRKRVVCAEDVFIHHVGQASFAAMGQQNYDRLFARNRARFEQKWQVVWTPHRTRPGVTPVTATLQHTGGV